MGAIQDDFRFAFRALRARPGFVIAAVLTLALGIGANTAIFSVINAFMLKPLPYPEGERLVEVHNTYPGNGLDNAGVSIPDFLDRREQAAGLEDLALFTWNSFNLAADGPPERLLGLVATPSLFSTLRVSPQLGRAFSEEEGVPGNDKAVILTHSLWLNRFDGAADIVGRDVRLNGESYRVVGVMPRGFSFPNREIDLYVPFAFTPEQRSDEGRGNEFSMSIGRLAPGATIERLNAQMDAIVQSNKDRFIGVSERAAGYVDFLERTGFTGRAQSWRDFLVGDVRVTLLVLQGVVVFVLLIACANVANLMLTRVLGRAREMATRAAVGADRARVARQLVLEGVLLGLGGGVVGLGLSYVVIRLIELFGIDRSSQNFDVVIDPQVLAFAFLVSIATGVVFSLLSVAALWRMDMQQVMKEGGGQTAGRGARFVRGVLVSLQVAMAATLLIGAGLLLRSFGRLLAVDRGFSTAGVLTVELSLPGEAYSEEARVVGFYRDLLERSGALPGVDSAAATSDVLLPQLANSGNVSIEGQGDPPDEERIEVTFDAVTPGYFDVLGIPVLAGRDVLPSDDAEAPPVTIVNAAMARRYWGSADDAVGRRFKFGDQDGDGTWYTVAGVVGDARRTSLEQAARPSAYFPHSQAAFRSMTLVVRTRRGALASPEGTLLRPLGSRGGDLQALVPAIRRTVRELDPTLPLGSVATLDAALAERVAPRRFHTVLLAAFAGLALFLSLVGIYGVIAQWVGERTREIGVRMALGAGRGDVLRWVLGQALLAPAIGLAIGIGLSMAVARALRSLLFEVGILDPLTYVVVPAVVLAVAAAATLWPALRATRVHPSRALHYE